MKRLILFLAYGAAALTILFALVLPIKGFPVFLSALGSLNLKIAPWFSGGEVAFVIDRGSHQIKVFHPVFQRWWGRGQKVLCKWYGCREAPCPPRCGRRST